MNPISRVFLLAGLAAPAFPQANSEPRTPRPIPPQSPVIDDVYEFGLDSVEQTFVIGDRPASRDLRLVVRLETDRARGEDAGGFTYATALDSVHFGRSFMRKTN